MRTLALLGLALLLAPDAPALGQEPETRVGDLVLRVPAGWKRLDQEGATAFAAPPSAQGKVTMLVLYAGDLKGGLRAAFDREWKALLNGYTVQQSFPVTTNQGPGGAELLATQAVMSDRAGAAWVGQLMGFQAEGRLQVMAFFSSDAPSPAYDQAVEALKGLLGSVRAAGPAPRTLSAQATPQPAPAAAGGGPSGVYRSVLANRTSADGTMVPASLVYKYATFFPDGVVLLEEDAQDRLFVRQRGGHFRLGGLGRFEFGRVFALGRARFLELRPHRLRRHPQPLGGLLGAGIEQHDVVGLAHRLPHLRHHRFAPAIGGEVVRRAEPVQIEIIKALRLADQLLEGCPALFLDEAVRVVRGRHRRDADRSLCWRPS